MRTFEILLLIANVVALLLTVKKQSKAVWLSVAGATMTLLLLHGLFEGFRWQMTAVYALVAIWVIMALLKASNKLPKLTIHKGLRITGKILGLGVASLLVAVTAFLAQAFPVFTLPKPTGEYAVGVKYLHLTDEKRIDPFISASGKKRELMVKMYYPAKADDTKPFAPYFNGSSELIQAYSEFYGAPFLFSHFNLVKTNTKNDLAVSNKQQQYPVVLFSHGGGTSMEVSAAQSEDLASRGYIVMSIDHPYVSAATAFPDRLVTAKEATTNFDVAEPAEPITKIMAEDVSYVIDELGELQKGNINPAFKSKINLARVGVIGHSVGGAVAYDVAFKDSRVKAAINLDGKVYVTPGNPKTMAPFLMLAEDRVHLKAIENRKPLIEQIGDSAAQGVINSDKQAADAELRKARQYAEGLTDTLKTSGNLYTIMGSDHMKFTDIGLYIGNPWLRDTLQISGSTDPARCLEITDALTAAFFDQHLRGSSNSMERINHAYPELKNITLK